MGYTYSEALEAVQSGLTIYRSGWNGSGLRVELQTPDEKSKMTMPYLFIRYPPHSRGAGQCGPWVPSNSDQFANDWCIEGRTSAHEYLYFEVKRIRAALGFCNLTLSQGAVCTEALRILGGKANPAHVDQIVSVERREIAQRRFPQFPWVDNRIVTTVADLDLILRRELISYGAYAERDDGDTTVIGESDLNIAADISELADMLVARAKLVELSVLDQNTELASYLENFGTKEEK